MYSRHAVLLSVEESEDLSSNVAGSGFVVVHDTLVGGEDDVTELSGGEDGGVEVLELGEGEVESGGDDTALVESTVELDNDLSGTGIIDDLELVDVAMALHASEELNEHLGDGAEEDLSFTGFLSVADVLESIIEDGHLNHVVSLYWSNK